MNKRQQGGVTLEVCIDSVDGAIAAEQGGADRIELCGNLLEGGTTPSTGLVREVIRATRLPVMVMARPRGGHFCYSSVEQNTLLAEVEALLEEPVAGIVIGALTTSGEIDQPLVRSLCDLAHGRSITFHRAFDQSADATLALEQLVDLGVDRILTSGQCRTADEGQERIEQLVRQAVDRISVMPGCGVRAHNVQQILQRTGAREIHFSGSRRQQTPIEFWRAAVPMSADVVPSDLERNTTNEAEVRAICEAARA